MVSLMLAKGLAKLSNKVGFNTPTLLDPTLFDRFARSPMLGDARPTFQVRSSVGWSLLLIKHCDQQFCSTQQCCSVLPLYFNKVVS